MSAATATTEAILLRRSRFGETSLVLVWLSPAHGKLRTAARGAGRKDSKLRGRLDLFYHAEIHFASGKKSDLHALREVKLLETWDGLRADYARLLAASYFADGGIDLACPPLRALLHIMRDGHYEGKTLLDPEVRGLFDPEKAIASDWYLERLRACAAWDNALWLRHVKNLETFIRRPHNTETAERLGLHERFEYAREMLQRTGETSYVESLRGTIGTQPLAV